MVSRGDGHVRDITVEDIQRGAVVRRYNMDGSLPPFSDTIILGDKRFNSWETAPTGMDRVIKLARPYIFPNEVMDGGSPLMWAEQYEVTVRQLIDRFAVVLTARGEVYIHGTVR